jgi:hypothetical protein
MNTTARVLRVETGKSTLVTFAADSWEELVEERAAFIASVRSAGGRAQMAKNSNGKGGRAVTFDTTGHLGGCVKEYVGWARVAS